MTSREYRMVVRVNLSLLRDVARAVAWATQRLEALLDEAVAKDAAKHEERWN